MCTECLWIISAIVSQHKELQLLYEKGIESKIGEEKRGSPSRVSSEWESQLLMNILSVPEVKQATDPASLNTPPA